MGMLGEHAELLNRLLIMKDDVHTDLLRGQLRMLAEMQDAVDNAPSVYEQSQLPKT